MESGEEIMPMPREVLTIDDVLNPEFIPFDCLKKGKIVKGMDVMKNTSASIHYDIKNIKELKSAIDELYSRNPSPTREDFVELFTKHHKKNSEDVDNFLDQLENDDDIFEVVERKENKGEITIKFKKIDQSDRVQIIKNIAKKLAKKLTKKQLASLLEEGIRKNNDTPLLKKIDEKLEKDNPTIEAKKGCFKIFVDGQEIMVM